jgi:hypothetical protein
MPFGVALQVNHGDSLTNSCFKYLYEILDCQSSHAEKIVGQDPEAQVSSRVPD